MATVVPTVVRYADEPTVVFRSEGPDGEPVETGSPPAELSEYVSEKATPATAGGS
ncbi:MAG: hypothetical protein ACRD2W_03720 [Acidimicrobiales bacterium]